jgi:hypothetical protein
VVDRPSALLDPARLALHLRIARSLGPATLLRAPNVIARGSSPRPRLCRLGLAGRALSGGELAPLATRGAPLDGFSSAEALAQGYDLACGLAHSSAFVADISGTSSCTAPSACTPTPVTPVPIPAPQPPGCTPCDPRPGFACPLVARPAVCVAEKAGTH